MPDDLYDRDFFTWSEQQAALLRRLAGGERVNELVDWTHVIEEVGDLGKSELNACRSLLAQAILHLMKIAAWPDDQAMRHWRGETRGFLSQARRRFAPGMRQHIGLDELYADALGQMREEWDGAAPPPLPERCPFAPDALLDQDADLDALLAGLAGSA